MAPTEQLDGVNDGIPVCISCHRSFARRVSEIVRCARCRATTCVVCSRTCSAPPLSLPPTPALTRSTTPSASPMSSPRRPALALSTNSRTSNALLSPVPPLSEQPAIGKRRKPLRRDTDGDEHQSWSSDDEKVSKEPTRGGCGRTICRNCCYENFLSAATTCYDCLNHPYSPPTQQCDAHGSH
ncbi:hypothetical protein DAEQUDRAFT_729674 [Daedalea quercina L-15889]|uniref:Uncharacterized protein n=1 Tax=Daedalea quercina L-15889 TaxID=1314783 RepID=A0A165NF75_9APHY|nr:hypothetical protein DAEQUDRAFT_729674 [Daedalea quercina L-15889]